MRNKILLVVSITGFLVILATATFISLHLFQTDGKYNQHHINKYDYDPTHGKNIDYSIRHMIDIKWVEHAVKVYDTINNNVSFIFYDSWCLRHVTNNAGEQFVRKIFNIVLSNNLDTLSDSIMIDIGANLGYYGLLSISYGIGTAVFIDPQPTCIQIIESLVDLNGYNLKSQVINHPIGQKDNIKLNVPMNDCGPKFPMDQKEEGVKNALGVSTLDNQIMIEAAKHTFVSFFTPKQIHMLNDEIILIMKIDTEGFELNILKLLFYKFETHELLNVIVELTPRWWVHFNHTIHDAANILSQIIEYGYNATNRHNIKINTKKEMIDYISNTNFKQLDFFFHCVQC